MSSWNSSARWVPGVNTGAPSSSLCRMWIIFPPALRYLARRSAMAFPLSAAFVTLSFPEAFLGC